jgi:lysozyme
MTPVINKATIDLVKASEGLRLNAYPDPATKAEPWTIGYGHTSAAGGCPRL